MGVLIPAEIEKLGELYDVEVSAIEFLAYNGHLIPFLQKMALVLASYFPDAPLRLQLARDPETGRELELWVMGTWRSDDWRVAIERLDAFRRDWWYDHSVPVRRQLAVNFDYAEEVAA